MDNYQQKISLQSITAEKKHTCKGSHEEKKSSKCFLLYWYCVSQFKKKILHKLLATIKHHIQPTVGEQKHFIPLQTSQPNPPHPLKKWSVPYLNARPIWCCGGDSKIIGARCDTRAQSRTTRSKCESVQH